MNKPKFVDIHALQVLPFSNINRDDMGFPKTVIFGGAERTRISSQSWKRVIRKHVEDSIDERAVRTRRLVRGVTERLISRGWERHEAEAAGIQVAISAGNGINLRNEKDDLDKVVLSTNALILLPEVGIDELTDLAAEYRSHILREADRAQDPLKVNPKLPSGKIQEILSRRSGTINLFGRMLTGIPSANVDGSVQMAHSFTTHRADMEYDFFTAVDDIEDDLGRRGTGHMGTGVFSAGTFYRYSNINLIDLLANVGGDIDVAATLVSSFLGGFITTVPPGKETSTAPVTPPDFVHVAVRDDRPVSLASAFESPVAGHCGYLTTSVEKLGNHVLSFNELLGNEHILFAGYTATAASAESREPLRELGHYHKSYASLVHDAVIHAYPGVAP